MVLPLASVHPSVTLWTCSPTFVGTLHHQQTICFSVFWCFVLSLSGKAMVKTKKKQCFQWHCWLSDDLKVRSYLKWMKRVSKEGKTAEGEPLELWRSTQRFESLLHRKVEEEPFALSHKRENTAGAADAAAPEQKHRRKHVACDSNLVETLTKEALNSPPSTDWSQSRTRERERERED